jgi:hypothetical protein
MALYVYAKLHMQAQVEPLYNLSILCDLYARWWRKLCYHSSFHMRVRGEET